MEMPKYKYKPIDIDLDGPGFRLVQLFRGNYGDDIRCDLFEGWIDQSKDGIPYDALSYTWGSTETAAQITVNGSTMHITSNLYTALQHIRFEGEDRLLWIDAICIDQENMDERRHQVQHMSSIYKEAERVIIWLGEGTEESDFIMDSMKRLQETNVKVEGDWRPSAQLWMNPHGGLRYMEYYIEKWREGMALMLGRPWFRRIWILQEIANARVADIHCGEKSVSARTFAQVPSIIGLKPEAHTQAVLDIMPGLSRKESWWGQDRNLHNLLVKFRESEATDERDMIYALLGISLDAYRSDILFPDYTKSLQQVIQDTTSFLLSHTGVDQSLYKFLHWKLPEFLQNLDLLRIGVLGIACEDGQEAMVEVLLATDDRAELNSRNKLGQTPLHQAARNGHETMVRMLLATGQVEIDAKDKDSRTLLLQVRRNGSRATVQLLLDKGAEIKSSDSSDYFHRTPLSYAAENGHEVIAQLLLEKGANIESRTSGRISDPNVDRTPLSYAAENGHETIVQLFLEKEADIDSISYNGRSPLSYAAENGHDATVQLLLQKGANINLTKYAGQTPLWWATTNKHLSTIQLLEKHLN